MFFNIIKPMQKFIDLANQNMNREKTVQETFKSADHLSFPAKNVEQEIRQPIAYSCDLAFTITLKPKFYVLTYEEQYRLSHDLIVDQLEDCKFTLTAELTSTYNVHYHGILKVPTSKGRDPLKWFFDRWRRVEIIGRIDCQQVKNYDVWTKYIIKDNKKDLDIPNCVKDDYDLLAELTVQTTKVESGTSTVAPEDLQAEARGTTPEHAGATRHVVYKAPRVRSKYKK